MFYKSYESNTLHRELMLTLNKQRSDEKLCDVTFIVGSKRICAHRFILSASCAYFELMFSSSFIEAHEKEIALKEVDEDAVGLVIDYIYTAQISISTLNAESILQVAHMLQLEEIKTWTCEFLKTQLDFSNCIGIAEFADTYTCKKLQSHANYFACTNFLKVMKYEEFLLISFTHLLNILNHDAFYLPPVASEEQLYHGIMAWVKYDASERKQYLEKLLRYIRLPLLGIEFLTETVKMDSIIKDDKTCGALVENSKKYLDEVCSRPEEKEGILLVVSSGRCAVVDNLELWPADWRKTSTSPMEDKPTGITDVAIVKGLVYVIDRQAHMNAYNPTNNQWTKCEPHTLNSQNTRLVAVNGYLFAFGSSTKLYGPTDFRAQRYSALTKKWRNFSTLHKGISLLGFSVVAVKELVYIIGGYTMDNYKSTAFKTIESFNIVTKQCTRIDTINLNSPIHIGAVVFKEKIYLAGGSSYRRGELGFTPSRDELRDTSTVRYFDPQTNQLVPCAKLTSSRANVNLVVHKLKLYAIGGMRNKTEIHTVEVYDEEIDKWQVCDDIIIPWYYNNTSKFVVIPLPDDYTRLEKWNSRVKSSSRVDLSQLRIKPKSPILDDKGHECLDNSSEVSDNYESNVFSDSSDDSENELDINDLDALLDFISDEDSFLSDAFD